MAAKLRPSKVVHSADDWEDLLLPGNRAPTEACTEVVFRADAAFAKPEIYEVLEERSVKCAIRIPSNENPERNDHRTVDATRRQTEPTSQWSGTRVSCARRDGRRRGESWRRWSFTSGSCFLTWGSS